MKFWIGVSLTCALCGCTSMAPQGSRLASAQSADSPLVAPPTISDLKEAEELAAKLPVDRTLIVFDIDDTLLTTELVGTSEHSFYGGDRWYVWQTDSKTDSKQKVGDCLIDLLTLNYAILPMMATQPDAPRIVARIPNEKLIITSRGPANRESTLRELRRAGFSSLNPVLSSEPFDFNYTEGKRTDLVSYQDGIMMTSGFNKGDMLRKMLEHSKKDYDYVILVDDTQKHIDRMRTALAGSKTTFYGLRYKGIKDDSPDGLKAVSKDQIDSHKRAYQAMLSLLPEISPITSAKFASGCPATSNIMLGPSL